MAGLSGPYGLRSSTSLFTAQLMSTRFRMLFCFFSRPVKHVLNPITEPSKGDDVGERGRVVVLVTHKPLLSLQAGEQPGRSWAPGNSQSLKRDCLDRQWCLPALNPCSKREQRIGRV